MQPADNMALTAVAPARQPRQAGQPGKPGQLSLLGPAWAELAFFLLFPGFFAYQTLLGLGLIRAYLGGYFAWISLLMLPPLLLSYLLRLRVQHYRLHRTDAALLGFLLYYAVIIACHAPYASGGHTGHHVLGLLYIFLLFVIFKTLDFERPRFRHTQLASLIAMSAVVFVYAVDGAFYLAALGAARDPDSVATYQGFSRSYLLPLVVMLACVRHAPLRWILYAIALPTLYLNTARSEFGALLFLLPLIEFHAARQRLLVLAALALAVVLLQLNLDALIAAVPGNRTLELLDLSHSSSANARHELTLHALSSIREHPLLGAYGSYPTGKYAHNIISAWVDLGLLGFVALLALLLYPLLQMAIHGYLLGGRASRAPRYLLAWSLLAMALLLLCMSHFFSDMLIGSALGAYARYRSGD